MRYELVGHTADVMVRCRGKTMAECFENAAYALFDQMIDASAVEYKIEKTIFASGDDQEERLFNFLSEMLYIMQTENVVFSDFKVTFENDKVKCVAKGEKLDLDKHKPKTEVKAVTYHELSVSKNTPCVTVIFDV